jgi:hypothetical protein
MMKLNKSSDEGLQRGLGRKHIFSGLAYQVEEFAGFP